jgi:hypothetical protein
MNEKEIKRMHEIEKMHQDYMAKQLQIAKQQSRGLGDTIAKITSAVGIKPCGGCKKRQEKLNQMFPYENQN